MLKMNYKHEIQKAKFTSFHDRNHTCQFGKLVQRDDVGFLKEVSRIKAAKKHKMSYEEYVKMWRENKSGVKQHQMFMTREDFM